MNITANYNESIPFIQSESINTNSHPIDNYIDEHILSNMKSDVQFIQKILWNYYIENKSYNIFVLDNELANKRVQYIKAEITGVKNRYNNHTFTNHENYMKMKENILFLENRINAYIIDNQKYIVDMNENKSSKV